MQRIPVIPMLKVGKEDCEFKASLICMAWPVSKTKVKWNLYLNWIPSECSWVIPDCTNFLETNHTLWDRSGRGPRALECIQNQASTGGKLTLRKRIVWGESPIFKGLFAREKTIVSVLTSSLAWLEAPSFLAWRTQDLEQLYCKVR